METHSIREKSQSIDLANHRLDTWIEQAGFKGWDPFDALNSPLLRRLTFGNRRLGQAWVQAFKHSPVNLRNLFQVPKTYNPKAFGLFLASYWRKYLVSQDQAHLIKTQYFAAWLLDHISLGYSGAGWGYNFPWPNRGFFAPAGTPTIVTTSFIALAFLDLSELSAHPGKHSLVDLAGTSPLEVARKACTFILEELNRYSPAPDELCFSYTPLDQRFIHNANLLGASLLARVAQHTQEADLFQAALIAANYSARRQQPNGAWLYGEGRVDRWVDNFHTGYVLVTLKAISHVLKTDVYAKIIDQGYTFWKNTFFLSDGTPRYYSNRTYPIDVHNVSQAIITFLAFSDWDSSAIDHAYKIAHWGIEHMQSPNGSFHYQHRPQYKIRTPYIRWSQAWMQRALTELCWREHENMD